MTYTHQEACSNRTFMELKFAYFKQLCEENKSSNRTFMELKLKVTHWDSAYDW